MFSIPSTCDRVLLEFNVLTFPLIFTKESNAFSDTFTLSTVPLIFTTELAKTDNVLIDPSFSKTDGFFKVISFTDVLELITIRTLLSSFADNKEPILESSI